MPLEFNRFRHDWRGFALACLLAVHAGCGTDASVGADDVAVAAPDVAPIADVPDSVDVTTGEIPDVSSGCTSDSQCPAATEPCHKNVCQPGAGCVAIVLIDTVVCSDGNPCTTGDSCLGGACQPGAAKACDDGAVCTLDSCDPGTGECAHAPATGTPCDDGNPCTSGDACAAGQCQGGNSTCECQADADCAKQDDGDACNGKLFCDKSGSAPACKLNPASVVKCSNVGDTACSQNTCDKATGLCGAKALPDATLCDDANTCTAGDVCKAGACVAGTNTCVCKDEADCKALDDGNLCNGTLFCNKASGKCEMNPTTVVNCPSVDDTACGKNLCDVKTGQCGVQASPEGTSCDDGNSCTQGDACQGGQCKPGSDTCACKADVDCIAQDDGNLCNGTLFCDVSAGKCKANPASVVNCPNVDDIACSKNTCQVKTGKCAKQAVADGAACDADGNTCTPADSCQAGACKAAANVCDCVTDSDCLSKEDGDFCNGTLYCDKTDNKCKVNPATVVFCPTVDDNPCQVNSCDGKSGACAQKVINEGGSCDADGNPCTVKDVCKAGSCLADANVCPCQVDGNCGAKEDGNLCNGTLYCDKVANLCIVNPKTVVTCPSWQDSECQKSLCDGSTGKCLLQPVHELAHCDADGNPCTLYDTCQAGQCSKGANLCACQIDGDCGIKNDADLCNGALYCDKFVAPYHCEVNPATVKSCADVPGLLCQVNRCQPKNGACQVVAGLEGKACDDVSECTSDDACKQGNCLGTPKVCDDGKACTLDFCEPETGLCKTKAMVCDDGNPCTTDSCDAVKGCVAVNLADGSACASDKCTTGGTCSAGQCSGKATVCDDGKPCTTDACDAKVGCTAAAMANGDKCNDGSVCTTKEACKDSLCIGTAVVCQGTAGCVSCDPLQGCTAVVGPCNDGNACTVGDACGGDKTCVAGKPEKCDDLNPCTKDGCDPKSGCTFTASLDPCEDGDACTSGDACKGGGCSGGPATACDDKNACTDDSCAAKTGCAHANNAKACDADASVCTGPDVCKAGVCTAGAKLDCDDKSACTTDSCDATLGCKHAGIVGACDDGNGCTVGETCTSGNCGGGKAVNCDDGLACSIDSCDPTVGCVHKTDVLVCDDGLPCTNDVCDATTKGCTHGAVANGSACGTNGQCSAGLCKWAVAIAAGTRHACALRPDGTVMCWGSNLYGQLGNGKSGSGLMAKVPEQVPDLTGVTGLVAGDDGTCALIGVGPAPASGKLKCWGENFSGNLGVSAPKVLSVPTEVAEVTDAISVAIGSKHSCSVRKSGVMTCWGSGTRGELGQGAGAPVKISPKDVFDPASASGGVLGGLLPSAASGNEHTCAVTTAGVVKCFGYNFRSQCGVAPATLNVWNPTDVKGLGPAEAIAGGTQFNCARLKDKTVACWGWGEQGSLGSGTTGIGSDKGVFTPAAVTGLTGVVDLAVQGDHACAVRSDGTVVCWGDNDDGQLGDGGAGASAVPVQVQSVAHAVRVATGGTLSCALTDLGQVLCWGANDVGQLGNGSVGKLTPIAAPVVGSGFVPAELCAIAGGCDDGDVCTKDACDAKTGSCTHVAAANGLDCGGGRACSAGICKWATSLVSGDSHTCALLAKGGTVSCWGSASSGQLGNGDSSGLQPAPKAVTGLTNVKWISAQGDSTCAVLADGTVSCWGANTSCQLGNGDVTKQAKATPVTVQGLTGAVGVAVGRDHACAWKTDGSMACWGEQGTGALGNGSSVPGLKCSAEAIPTLKSAAFMAAGDGATFMHYVLGQPSLKSWGTNESGMLGIGNFSTAPKLDTPTTFTSADSGLTGLSAGYRHACYGINQGYVYCWGDNQFGQLGNGGTGAQFIAPYAASLGTVFAAKLALGYQHTCIVAKDGTAWCWGLNADGQLGNGGTTNVNKPVQVKGWTTAADVAPGRYHTCGLSQLGDVVCWGRNESGQLGTGKFGAVNNSLIPVAIQIALAPIGDVCKLKSTCDDKNPCTIDTCDAKTAACSHVASPDGAVDLAAPLQCPLSGQVCSSGACKQPQFKAIASGDDFTCALSYGTPTLLCWGYNFYGQLGSGQYGFGGNKYASAPPTAVLLASTGNVLSGVTSFGASGNHACAVQAGGKVYCWGSNNVGEAGTGETGNTYNKAMSTLGVTTATSITAGTSQTCALLGNGTATCWGLNDKGQLGGGTTTVQTGLVAVQGLIGLTGVSSGQKHACAVGSTGAVWCWGANSFGQLGNGNAVNSPTLASTPSLVPGMTEAVSVYAADEHSCALRLDGTVSCWGSGANGKTGTGFGGNSSIPAQMLIVSGVTHMAVGDKSTCVVAKGKALCMGLKGFGQIGVDPALDVLTDKPAVITGLDAVKQVSVGQNHACALRIDGSVWCWGKDDHGQLGDAGFGGQSFMPKLVLATAPK